jgi:hypothetical protein
MPVGVLEQMLMLLSDREREAFMTYKFVMGQRYGQAFFNALDFEDQEKLRGTTSDPFYRDSLSAIEDAIDYLTQP